MNKQEVTLVIKKVGTRFTRIMECLCDPEYTAGYKQACNDMIKLFEYAPMFADYESERKAMLDKIKQLRAENAELKQRTAKQDSTIQTLLKHVDVCDVLNVRGVGR